MPSAHCFEWNTECRVPIVSSVLSTECIWVFKIYCALSSDTHQTARTALKCRVRICIVCGPGAEPIHPVHCPRQLPALTWPPKTRSFSCQFGGVSQNPQSCLYTGYKGGGWFENVAGTRVGWFENVHFLPDSRANRFQEVPQISTLAFLHIVKCQIFLRICKCANTIQGPIEDCCYYCSWRNNVVVLFGTLQVQSFMLTDCAASSKQKQNKTTTKLLHYFFTNNTTKLLHYFVTSTSKQNYYIISSRAIITAIFNGPLNCIRTFTYS